MRFVANANTFRKKTSVLKYCLFEVSFFFFFYCVQLSDINNIFQEHLHIIYLHVNHDNSTGL